MRGESIINEMEPQMLALIQAAASADATTQPVIGLRCSRSSAAGNGQPFLSAR
jgi:hypothetical protein